jgi:tetratricopeptide (TPR) repeat protein
LGGIYCSLGNYAQAIDCQQKLLQIAKEIGKQRGEGDALSNLGAIYSAMGAYPQAIAYYQQALQITREVGQRPNTIYKLL